MKTKEEILGKHGCNACYLLYKQKNQCKKPVRQIDIKTKKCINIFPSAKDAEQITGIERRAIGRVCIGKKNRCWRLYLAIRYEIMFFNLFFVYLIFNF